VAAAASKVSASARAASHRSFASGLRPSLGETWRPGRRTPKPGSLADQLVVDLAVQTRDSRLEPSDRLGRGGGLQVAADGRRELGEDRPGSLVDTVNRGVEVVDGHQRLASCSIARGGVSRMLLELGSIGRVEVAHLVCGGLDDAVCGTHQLELCQCRYDRDLVCQPRRSLDWGCKPSKAVELERGLRRA
jgi:hypothetical protein